MKNIMKVIVLVMCLILSLGSIVYAQEPVLISAPIEKDYEGHWAQTTIEKWLNAGKVSGDPDGRYRPDDYVTRAEFVRMTNSIIDYNGKSDITYKDIGANDWFYDFIRVAQKLGYISGYSDEAFGPNDNITREQAASIAARIQYLDNYEAGLEKYTDMNKISEWAKATLGATSNAGFIKGYEDGSVRPLNFLTRAEALTMLDNIMVNAKNIIVYNGDVELKDTIIDGDLIIAHTVGTGKVKLTNAVVNGRIRIFGGQVTFSGKYKKVIASGDSDLTFDDGEIDDLTVDKPIALRGKGKIKNLRANANGIKHEKEVEIEKVILGPGVTEEPAPLEEEVPIIGGGGGGGGGGPVVPTTVPVIQISIKTPDKGQEDPPFNSTDYKDTNKFSEFFVQEIKSIFNNASNSSRMDGYIDKINDRLEGVDVNGIKLYDENGWTKAIVYLDGTAVKDDVISIKDELLDGIDKEDVNYIFALYDKIATGDTAKIVENLKALDSASIKYNNEGVTYKLTYKNNTAGLTKISEIADFILNEMLFTDKNVKEFFDTYGEVKLTATQGEKTSFITIKSATVIK